MSFPREELLGRADELVDRVAESSSAALRLPKIVMDTSGAHPVADDLAQVVLFESRDKHRRMTDFLEKRSTYART
jgi:enoyl-CoA hydratase/carnithine racemase